MSAELRLRGNDLYRSHSYKEALGCYFRALQCDEVSEAEKAKLYNNLAACFLKLKKFENVVKNADLCEFLHFSNTFILFYTHVQHSSKCIPHN